MQIDEDETSSESEAEVKDTVPTDNRESSTKSLLPADSRNARSVTERFTPCDTHSSYRYGIAGRSRGLSFFFWNDHQELFHDLIFED